MKYHPDRNKDDKESERKFKESCRAYEILKDPEKRSAYDQYGHDAFRQGGGVKGLEILVVVFQIFLKSFLVVVLVAVKDKEVLKEGVIFVTICQFLFKKHLLEKNLK